MLADAARFILIAALLTLWASPGHAAQSSAQFIVLINFNNQGEPPNAGLCRSSARVGVFGEAVTVICSSGKIVPFSGDTSELPWSPAQDGSYRFVALAPQSYESLGEISSYAGVGTVTSWRVVRLSNMDYLELMIGW